MSGAGDIDNDGHPDVIVGSIGNDTNGSGSGSATIFSGANGYIISTFYGESSNDNFGKSVSGAGDFNNDGYDDVIVGAPNTTNYNSGTATIFSGINGDIILQINGRQNKNGYLGTSVSGLGDIDGDGYGEVIVGSHGDDINGYKSGHVRVISANQLLDVMPEIDTPEVILYP